MAKTQLNVGLPGVTQKPETSAVPSAHSVAIVPYQPPLEQTGVAKLIGAAYGSSAHRTEGAGTNAELSSRTARVAVSSASIRLGPPVPKTGEVRSSLPAVLEGMKDPPLEQFQARSEAYFSVYFHPKTGRLSIRKVATGSSEDRLRISAAMISDKKKPGETVLGGFHNHPGHTDSEPSALDRGSAKTLKEVLPEYRDFVLTTNGGAGKLTEIIAGNNLDAVHITPERLTYASVHRMNDDLRRGVSGTEGLHRADKAHIPGDQDHVHTDEGPAIKKGGGWKDRGGATDAELDELLSKKNKQWLKSWGWNV